MKKFKMWLEEKTIQTKCYKCGATGKEDLPSKHTSFTKIQGKTYCDACARQIRREENK
jgi:hypothetical protein